MCWFGDLFIVESMEGRCLELRRVRSHIPFCWIGPDNPSVLKTTSVCYGFETLLQLTHPFEMTASVFWIILLFRWRFGWLGVGMLFILSIRRRWALLLLPFAFGLLGRGLRQHLIKNSDRFLLSSNYIKLFSLDSSLLFELPGHFLGSFCHVSKGGCLRTRIWRLGFNDGRMLINHLNFPSQ